jgi:hypothetical protein
MSPLATLAVMLLVCGTAMAADMAVNPPPCPTTVPCRTIDEPSKPPQRQNASTPVPISSMLPCPLSVPCIANDDGDDDYADDDAAPVPRPPYAAQRPVSKSHGLILRVITDDPDADDGSDASSNMPPQPIERSSHSPVPKLTHLTKNATPPGHPISAGPGAQSLRAVPVAHRDSVGLVPVARSPEKADVSLAGAGDLETQAVRSVMESGAKLAQVDSSSFDADDAQTYVQASELASAARHALGDRDYLAAVDLSRKATELAGTLTARQKSAH